MKLVYAIVRNDNEDDVTAALNAEHFYITKLSTVGGFLRKGNVTLLIVTEDDKVNHITRSGGLRQTDFTGTGC